MICSALGWQALNHGVWQASFMVYLRLRWVRESIDGLLPVGQIGGEFIGARLLAKHGAAPVLAAAGCSLQFGRSRLYAAEALDEESRVDVEEFRQLFRLRLANLAAGIQNRRCRLPVSKNRTSPTRPEHRRPAFKAPEHTTACPHQDPVLARCARRAPIRGRAG